MPLFDMPLNELLAYDPPTTFQSDFDSFWSNTLQEASHAPLNALVTRVETPILGVDAYEVFYDGWHGARICGWFLVPQKTGPFPTLVQYHGYSGYKGELHNFLGWVLQGYAVFAVDVRGQSGNSTDPGPYSGGHATGWMTKGIMDPQEYYYRGAYVDCVRALDFVGTRPEVNTSRIAITGVSQGGGLTLAVAALDHRPVLAMPEVPYLCHYKRAIDTAVNGPYPEITHYLHQWPQRENQVWTTLSYFDNLNLASKIQCPLLCTVGLQDDVCPPSTVFAAYNKITATKEIKVYPYHKHEAVTQHWDAKFAWMHHYLLDMDTL